MSESQTPVAGAQAPAPNANPDLRWYVVHAYSGMEKAVERNIVERINRAGMQSKFGRFLVPTEEVVEIKNGQKKTTERRFFPGYVLVEMVMDDESWHLVKHTNKVTGFVGGAKNRPAPISEGDVRKIVEGNQIVIYNSGFDTQFFPDGVFAKSKVECAMLAYAEFKGEWNPHYNNYRWHKLSVAAAATGFRDDVTFHRALGDALAARHVWLHVQREMAVVA